MNKKDKYWFEILMNGVLVDKIYFYNKAERNKFAKRYLQSKFMENLCNDYMIKLYNGCFSETENVREMTIK